MGSVLSGGNHDGRNMKHLNKAHNDLPLQNHRNLIEPISGSKHIRYHLVKRFLSLIKQIEDSPKGASKHLLKIVKYNARSTTGSNLRNILLLTDKHDVDDLDPSDCSFVKYHPLNNDEQWKIIQEAINVKQELLEVEGFTLNKTKDTFNNVHTYIGKRHFYEL